MTGNTIRPALWTYADVARYLNCSVSTVRRLVKKRLLTPIRWPHGVRFRPADVREYIIKNQGKGLE